MTRSQVRGNGWPLGTRSPVNEQVCAPSSAVTESHHGPDLPLRPRVTNQKAKGRATDLSLLFEQDVFDSTAKLRQVLADGSMVSQAFKGQNLTVASALMKTMEGYRLPDIVNSIKAMQLRPLEHFGTALGALALKRQLRVAEVFTQAIPPINWQLREISTLSNALAAQVSVASFVAPPAYQRLVQGPLLTGLRDLGGVGLTDPDGPPAAFSVVAASGALGATTSGAAANGEEREGDAPGFDTTIGLVRGFDVKLAVRVEGAFFALRSGSPDGISQAAHSLQEAMDRTLRAAAPADVAASWCQAYHPDGLTREGRVTRAGRVRYLAHTAGLTTDATEPIVRLLAACASICQKAKHDEVDPLAVRHYAPLVEGVVGAFVSMALAASERRD
jgi:hypothetical protein